MHRHRLAAYRQIWFENHKKGGSASVHKLGAVAADPEALPLVAQTSNVSTSQFPSQNNNPYDPVAPRPRPQYNNSNHAQYTPQYNEYSDPYAKAPYNPAPFGTDTSSYSRNGYHHQQAGNATSYPTPLPYRQ
jgi:hypothetical protein